MSRRTDIKKENKDPDARRARRRASHAERAHVARQETQRAASEEPVSEWVPVTLHCSQPLDVSAPEDPEGEFRTLRQAGNMSTELFHLALQVLRATAQKMKKNDAAFVYTVDTLIFDLLQHVPAVGMIKATNVPGHSGPLAIAMRDMGANQRLQEVSVVPYTGDGTTEFPALQRGALPTFPAQMIEIVFP